MDFDSIKPFYKDPPTGFVWDKSQFIHSHIHVWIKSLQQSNKKWLLTFLASKAKYKFLQTTSCSYFLVKIFLHNKEIFERALLSNILLTKEQEALEQGDLSSQACYQEVKLKTSKAMLTHNPCWLSFDSTRLRGTHVYYYYFKCI